jgi:isopentenyl-diphosphate delta-isomerase
MPEPTGHTTSGYSTRANPTPGDSVLLVDENDRPLGWAPKLEAHLDGGRLHRAFSVFVFDAAGRMLLQRRAAGKYHFGGLWTNACCSHPGDGRTVAEFARDRLRHEFGFDVPLEELFSFVYRAHDPASGLTEHEFDHVLVGRFDGEPAPNPEEIESWEWVHRATLLRDVEQSPGRYTPWFKIVLHRVLERVPAGRVPEGPDALSND